MNKNRKFNPSVMRVSHIAYIVAAQLILPSLTISNANARDYFNPALLELGAPGQGAIDISAFSERGGQIPGTYRVDIILNNEKIETRDITFRQNIDSQGNKKLYPCLSVEQLGAMGVLTDKYPELNTADESCSNIYAVPQATSDFLFDNQQLLLSFPQSAVSNAARGWVDPRSWDDGIPAVFLNYSSSGSNTSARSGQNNQDSESQYLNLRPGINLGPWRVRNYTTWTRNQTKGKNGVTDSKWDTVYTYVQRDIKMLRSQLTLGDSSTPADIFDSLSFRGIQLSSDDEMVPESIRGYAPVVRGIARTNAQVVIRQNGYTIYETYVSPGNFEITDMYPTGGSGDLNVTIRESDGSEQYIIVPFASLPILQREGRAKYSLTSAVYRSYDNSIDETPFTQGTLIYGLPRGFTLYGGSQASSHYQSLALGLGKNLGPIGAISVDMTQAWSQMKNEERENGRSFRARYSKNFIQTGTNFSIAGYRYATDGFWNMQEVLETYRSGSNYLHKERRRNRLEFTTSQSLGKNAGSLSLTAIREDYWNSGRTLASYGANYNNSIKGIGYSLGYTYNRNSHSTSLNNRWNGKTYETDHLFSLNISVPLNILFGERPTYASYSMNTSKRGSTTNMATLSGALLEGNNLNWSVSEGYTNKGKGNSGNLNANWRATYGEMNLGYSHDKFNHRVNYGLQGSILIHDEGITLGQPLGETAALISAPGGKSISVQGQTGVKTDFRGYAIVPFTSPYRKNDITLDTQTFDDHTEVEITTATVIPTRGAIVKANYNTSVGYRVLMAISRSNGQMVPFGATVTEQNAKHSQGFIVGDNGQVYLTGLPRDGVLIVKWGTTSSTQCSINYSVPQNQDSVINMNGLCR